MLAIAQLLVGLPMLGRFVVRNQRSNPLVLQDYWGCGIGLTTLPCKTSSQNPKKSKGRPLPVYRPNLHWRETERDITYKACPSESGTDKFMQRFI